MGKFRLVAWNCAGGFHKKAQHLAALEPDVAVVSEVRRACLQRMDCFASKAVWMGTERGNGVAVLGFNGWSLVQAETVVPERWFVPVIATNAHMRLQIVGTCVQKDGSYVAPTLRAIDQLGSFIVRSPTIIAGDFNQSSATDHRYPAGKRSTDTWERMSALGMRSAWHSHSGETPGCESEPSHLWGPSKRPFHIDYAFVSRSLRISDVRFGSFEHYSSISDHVPLVVDIQLSDASM